MPELPEVETVKRGLEPLLLGKQIKNVQVFERRLRIPVPADFEAKVAGLKVLSIERRAKYLLIHCSRQTSLLVHLGMSGSLIIRDPAHIERRKHDHIVFTLDDGWQVYFHDPRRFGVVTYCPTGKLAEHKLLANLGPEPLSDDWTADVLYASLQRRKGPVKPIIMDQALVVGVGNIYASEALHMSHIHPERPAASLTRKEVKALHKAIRYVLEDAIASGGSTLRDYVRSSGDAGYFQHHFKVFGRQNLPCLTCNNMLQRIKQAGRSSFFCPVCQPK